MSGNFLPCRIFSSTSVAENTVQKLEEYFGEWKLENLPRIPENHYLTPDDVVYTQTRGKELSGKLGVAADEVRCFVRQVLGIIVHKHWEPDWLSPQDVDFLRRLLRQIPGDLLVIWDGLRQHRSRRVRDFVADQDGRLTLEYLPAYAPELNPVEYVWGYWKRHELPNFCPRDFGQLNHHARRALRSMQRRSTLVRSFWEQAQLF